MKNVIEIALLWVITSEIVFLLLLAFTCFLMEISNGGL